MNNLECLVYISRCTLNPEALNAAFDDIVTVSAYRNADARITGILAYQDGYFVQVLEGSPAALDLLMIHLHFDPRHEDIRVIARSQIPAKNGISWSMISPPKNHPQQQALSTLLANEPASVEPWRNLLLEIVPQAA